MNVYLFCIDCFIKCCLVDWCVCMCVCVCVACTGREASGSAQAAFTASFTVKRGNFGETVEGSLEGISNYFHYTYEWVGDTFKGLRMFYHYGIGTGEFLSAERVDAMWKEEGLKEFEGELGAPLPVSLPTLRVFKGEERKKEDSENARLAHTKAQNKVANATMALNTRDEKAKKEAENRGAHFCSHCARPFKYHGNKNEHEKECEQKQREREHNRQTASLRPASTVANSTVQQRQSVGPILSAGVFFALHMSLMSFMCACLYVRVYVCMYVGTYLVNDSNMLIFDLKMMMCK